MDHSDKPTQGREHEELSTPAGATPFFVVGVGASAGGLEALQEFFAHIEEGSGIAFVVLQHLSPDFKSMMADLIARDARLHVVDAEDGMTVEPEHIYVLPQRKDMRIENGHLVLTERVNLRGLHLPIDMFFESLARAQGELSAAVVLSGTGSDGTRGLRAVKEAGGLAFVQDPSSARFDGMPRSAIGTGIADCVRAPRDLAQALVRAVHMPSAKHGDLAEDDNAAKALFERVQAYCGVDFSLYKPATVQRRIRRRLFINGLSSLQDYLHVLEEDSGELDQFVRELLIGVTRFFRDPEAWHILRNGELPKLLSRIPEGSVLRAWIAGCSTGEEAYTLAMLLDDAIRESKRTLTFRIFATDVNSGAIAFASAGVYHESIVADVPEAIRERHFERREERYVVRRALRDNITFAIHNVAADPPFTRLDLVVCRNLLIYLRAPVQTEVLHRLAFGLREDGLLFLGASESLRDEQSALETTHSKWKLFSVRSGARSEGREGSRASFPVGRLAKPTAAVPSKRPSDTLVQQVAERFGPPGVAVTEGFDVLHLFGDAGRYLSLPPGRVQMNLLKLVPQPLSVMLGSSVRRVLESRSGVRFPHVDLGEGVHATVRVEPLYGVPGVGRGLFVFFEGPYLEESDVQPVNLEHATAARLSELEDELSLTRDSLHSAVQDLEASNEELQATNEELIASNEELQSTNEELQSVNEELYTVNSEYQEKIDELERLNDDLENLLRFVSVGTLFLDRRLCIRRYNERVRTLFPLIQQDIGRPVDDIALKAHYPELGKDVRKALEGAVLDEREIPGDDGSWWSVRVAPLVRSDSTTGGVILTFNDVTRLHVSLKRNEWLGRASSALGARKNVAGYLSIDLDTREVGMSDGVRSLLQLDNGESYRDGDLASSCMRHLDLKNKEEQEIPLELYSSGGEKLSTRALCVVEEHGSDGMLLAAVIDPTAEASQQPPPNDVEPTSRPEQRS